MDKLENIKWILFDQAGVQTLPLFSNKDEYFFNNKFYSAKRLNSIFNTPLYSDFSVGKISEDELIESFLMRTSIQLTVDEYKSILKSSVVPIDGMRELLEELKVNYKLGTLINEGKEWANYKLDIPDFRKYFRAIAISGEIGLEKPNQKFYETALELLNTDPMECIFIDDKQINCNGAEFAGMTSILFKDAKQLRAELKNYGIKLK